MKIGLIARCDSTGLGIQSKEFFDHIKCKALVIDFSAMAPVKSFDSILKPNIDWYPGQKVFRWGKVHNVRGDIPIHVINEFLDGLDIVFAMETPYDFNIFDACAERGIKTIIQPNYEFLDFPSNRIRPPSLFGVPSKWNWHNIPEPKKFLPVPVNTDIAPISGFKPRTFLHIAGRPAHADRNGTQTLFKALKYVKEDITIHIRSQWPVTIPQQTYRAKVKIEVDYSNKQHYFDNYTTGGVLVMPRKYGGLCLPMNEALACEMPIITTDISPNHLWLPGEWLVPSLHTGSFLSKKKVDVYEAQLLELAAKIDQFCNEDFYREAIGKAREIKEAISWKSLHGLYMETFNEVLQ